MQQQVTATAEIDTTSASQASLEISSQEKQTTECNEAILEEYHAEHTEHHKEDFELDVSITTQVQEETYVEVENDADIEAALAKGKLFSLLLLDIKGEHSLQRIDYPKCGRTACTSTATIETVISVTFSNTGNVRCSY